MIGQYYEGGIIAYVNNTGQHGYLISPTDIGSALGGCVGPYSNVASMDDGLTNSINMKNTSCNYPNIAQVICLNYTLNGIGGWFLPAKNQFSLIYGNLVGQNVLSGRYWTSTCCSSNWSWWLNGDGSFGVGGRQDGYMNVRAMRTF